MRKPTAESPVVYIIPLVLPVGKGKLYVRVAVLRGNLRDKGIKDLPGASAVRSAYKAHDPLLS